MFGAGTLDERMLRRSIYFMIKRSKLIPSMQLFDSPEPLVSQQPPGHHHRSAGAALHEQRSGARFSHGTGQAAESTARYRRGRDSGLQNRPWPRPHAERAEVDRTSSTCGKILPTTAANLPLPTSCRCCLGSTNLSCNEHSESLQPPPNASTSWHGYWLAGLGEFAPAGRLGRAKSTGGEESTF